MDSIPTTKLKKGMKLRLRDGFYGYFLYKIKGKDLYFTELEGWENTFGGVHPWDIELVFTKEGWKKIALNEKQQKAKDEARAMELVNG